MHIAAISFSSPVPLPLLARAVRAGFPSPADDFIEEEIDLQRLLVTNRVSMSPKTGRPFICPTCTQTLPSVERYAGLTVMPPSLSKGDTEPLSRPTPQTTGNAIPFINVRIERAMSPSATPLCRVTPELVDFLSL